MKIVLRAYSRTIALGLALALGACANNQFGAPCPIPVNATMEQQQAALAACTPVIGEGYIPDSFRNELDILFMIDNSYSMAQKQAGLAQNITAFIKAIDSIPNTDYHVGIVTSDVGAAPATGLFSDPTGVLGSCNTFQGDDGLLQVTPCTQRTGLSRQATAACASICQNPTFGGANFKTTDGNRFISKVLGKTNVPVDLQPDPMNPGQMIDLGPTEAFQCMGLVGDAGCGIEGQLEGAKRALDGHRPENANFLSNDAYLAIIFITDEDDCSVQASRRDENSPSSHDCQAPDQNASYDCYNPDYRCLARSVQCDQPMNQQGQKTNCVERPDNYLNSVQSYHDAFSSYVSSPDHLLVSGIWTRPSITDGGPLNIAYSGSGFTSADLNRAPDNLAACHYTGQNPNLTEVFGQAQRRLSAFAASFGTVEDPMTGNMVQMVQEFSVCDIDNYGPALNHIFEQLLPLLKPPCLSVVPKKLSTGQPNCLVGDVDATNPQGLPDVLFPVCSDTCCQGFASSNTPSAIDPTVKSACAADTVDCYCAVKSLSGQCSDQTGIVAGVWRGSGNPPPAGKVTNYLCAGGGTAG